MRAASRSGTTRFDWSDPDGWDAVLRDVAALYLVAPTTPGPVHDFVARAEVAGVRRVVLLSGHGADRWGDTAFGADMLAAEDAVRSSTLAWTVLRPSNFAQNFDEELWHAPLVAGELALPAGPVGEPFVDVDDVADVAAAALTGPGPDTGRVHELTGPRAIPFGEAVDLVARATGRSIGYRSVSPEQYRAALVEQGLGADEADAVAAMFVMMADGRLADTTDELATLLGRPPRTFEDYVLRGAAAGAWDR